MEYFRAAHLVEKGGDIDRSILRGSSTNTGSWQLAAILEGVAVGLTNISILVMEGSRGIATIKSDMQPPGQSISQDALLIVKRRNTQFLRRALHIRTRRDQTAQETFRRSSLVKRKVLHASLL